VSLRVKQDPDNDMNTRHTTHMRSGQLTNFLTSTGKVSKL